MKLLTTVVTCIGLIISSLNTLAAEVHYIGFNKFNAQQRETSARAFDNYTRDLRPIMARHGMTLQVYSVVHGASKEIEADAITFGTAPDQQSFQAFFQDPDLQAIFPTLVAALSRHQVVFTAGEFNPEHSGTDALLLQMDWFDESPSNGMQYQALLEQYAPVIAKYGVRRLASSKGIMSNLGLAGEIVARPAPQAMELWSMQDAHGFFDDPKVKQTNHKISALVTRSEAFWLRRRDDEKSSEGT
jgi:hypothetical protein